MPSLLKTRNGQVFRKRRKRSCLELYFLTEDKKYDCRSRLIRPFKLLLSCEMIDAHIPHLHRKSGNRSCLAMLLQDEKIFLSDFTISLTLSLTSSPFFPSFFFRSHFMKLFIRLCLTSSPCHRYFHCNFVKFLIAYTSMNDFIKVHSLSLSLCHLNNHYRFNITITKQPIFKSRK